MYHTLISERTFALQGAVKWWMKKCRAPGILPVDFRVYLEVIIKGIWDRLWDIQIFKIKSAHLKYIYLKCRQNPKFFKRRCRWLKSVRGGGNPDNFF